MMLKIVKVTNLIEFLIKMLVNKMYSMNVVNISINF